MRRALPLLLAFVLGAAACAVSRDVVLTKSLAGVNAAREAFVAFDKAHQDGIVADSKTFEGGRLALDAYREQRNKVTIALVAAYGAIAVAAADVTDSKSLVEVVDAMTALVSALQDLGVVPKGGK